MPKGIIELLSIFLNSLKHSPVTLACCYLHTHSIDWQLPSQFSVALITASIQRYAYLFSSPEAVSCDSRIECEGIQQGLIKETTTYEETNGIKEYCLSARQQKRQVLVRRINARFRPTVPHLWRVSRVKAGILAPTLAKNQFSSSIPPIQRVHPSSTSTGHGCI